jgi:hypothetical protein
MADHGSRQSYGEGCRCQECKSAQAVYMREWKARKAGADIPEPRKGRPKKGESASVTPIRTPKPDVIGDAQQAVLDELETLTVAGSRKSAAQAALAMARILDNPAALPQQPTAAAKLMQIMDDLRKGSGRSKGRLVGLQQMTKISGT